MAEVTVPNPVACTGRQLSTCWGPDNSLLLHVKKSKAEQQQQQGFGGEETEVHEVWWETTLYEPVFCKLVNESLGIFLSLQKLAEEEAGVVSDLLVKRACFNLLTKKLIEILFALLWQPSSRLGCPDSTGTTLNPGHFQRLDIYYSRVGGERIHFISIFILCVNHWSTKYCPLHRGERPWLKLFKLAM